MKPVATAVSYIFHPLLLTTYLILFLGYFFPVLLGINPVVLMRFSLFVFIITFLFPVLNIGLMVRLAGRDASMTMQTRRERVVPFIIISLIYGFFAGLIVYRSVLSSTFNGIILVIAALVIIGTLITFFYKISIHSLALGGFAGILMALNRMSGGMLLYPTVAVVVLMGVVMSSRLFLNAHTLREVLSGALTGFVAGLAGMVLLGG